MLRSIVPGILAAGVLAVVAASAGAAGAPELAEGVKIEAGGAPIDSRIGHLVPCVADWNNDGKKDLLVGEFEGGRVRLYLNVGTDAAPAFGKFEHLKAGGKTLSVPAG
ncbi:MAG: hypothetical protein MUC63_02015 [Planctomycetes bacterium]|nr:hypothetical protein [Planctomycetota bacterium]